MKVLFASFLTLLITVGALAQAPPSKVVFTEKDREFALKYLNDTKADYLKHLTGISDAQLNFRSGEGRWTIAEIAEHIIVVENALFGMLTVPTAARSFKCEEVPRFADTVLVLAITTALRNSRLRNRSVLRDSGKLAKI